MHQVNLIQVTADDVFPVKGVNTIFEGSERLMHYVFDEYIPKFFDRIDQVILVADYSGYSKKELTNFLECNNTYFKEFELPHIYIGQTSKYKVEYPVLMSMVKDYKLDTEDYLLINKQKIDDFMLKELGDTKYIQLDHLENFSNDDNNYKMMYDAEHLSTVGTAYYSRKLEDYLLRN